MVLYDYVEIFFFLWDYFWEYYNFYYIDFYMNEYLNGVKSVYGIKLNLLYREI